MKRTVIFIVVVSFLTCSGALAAPYESKVKAHADGTYVSFIAKDFAYYVDTKIQICFFQNWERGGSFEIPCAKLAKRKEWKPIITWVK